MDHLTPDITYLSRQKNEPRSVFTNEVTQPSTTRDVTIFFPIYHMRCDISGMRKILRKTFAAGLRRVSFSYWEIGFLWQRVCQEKGQGEGEAMTAAKTKRVLTVPACWHRDDKHPPHPKYLGCHPRDRLSVTGSARPELRGAARFSSYIRSSAFRNEHDPEARTDGAILKKRRERDCAPHQ